MQRKLPLQPPIRVGSEGSGNAQRSFGCKVRSGETGLTVRRSHRPVRPRRSRESAFQNLWRASRKFFHVSLGLNDPPAALRTWILPCLGLIVEAGGEQRLFPTPRSTSCTSCRCRKGRDRCARPSRRESPAAPSLAHPRPPCAPALVRGVC